MLQQLIFIYFILVIKAEFGVPTNELNVDKLLKLTPVETTEQAVKELCEEEPNGDFIFQFENLTQFLLEADGYQANLKRFSDYCSMCRSRQQGNYYSEKSIVSKFIIEVKSSIPQVSSELEHLWTNFHNTFCEIEKLERCTNKKYTLEFSTSGEDISFIYKDSRKNADLDKKPWPDIIKIILSVSEFYFGMAYLEFENKLLQLTVPGVVKTKTIIEMLGDLKKIITIENIHPLSSFTRYPICQKYRNILKKRKPCTSSVDKLDEKKYSCILNND
ncbi:hypothetical protein ACJMK2_032704 [Sinanodonta woodiana]|uniref:Uncharacterized protein n=1 Tax=Sinanodonta woodiana TaxID=1069815 RepID=A0ABD3X6L1_SINWO